MAAKIEIENWTVSSNLLVPVMVHVVDDRNKEVLFVELERGPERVTKFALVQVVRVRRAHLATVVSLVISSASNWNVR